MLLDLLIERLDEILVCHLLDSIFHALDKVWVKLARVVVIEYVKDPAYHKRAAGALSRY